MIEKSNIINVLVSLFMIGFGIGFIYIDDQAHEIACYIGIFLLAYGVLRIIYTNYLTKQ